ncbi:MAG: shikimate dehydrogenase [Pseudomonadota bacterium]
MTALYGVIGDPVAHSLSPLIHKGWIREFGFDADYLAMHVPANELGDALDTLNRRGGNGANITLPHKEDALRLCDKISDRAEAIGAVNTIWRTGDGIWSGDNTDAPGFRDALDFVLQTEDFDKELFDADGQALVIGAGGASRAVAYVFGEDRRSTIFCNRTPSRAEAMISVYHKGAGDRPSSQKVRAKSLEHISGYLEDCAFAVNATSLGHSGQSLNWPPGRGRLLYDLSYGVAAEAFLKPARTAGWRTVDGLRMLVAQAAYSFEIWFGEKPDIDSAMDRCRRTLESLV